MLTLPINETGASSPLQGAQYRGYLVRAALVQEAEEVPHGDPLLQVFLQWQGMQQWGQHLDTRKTLAPGPACSAAGSLALSDAPQPYLGLRFPRGTGYQQAGKRPTDVVMDTIMAFSRQEGQQEPQKFREVSGPKSRNRHRGRPLPSRTPGPRSQPHSGSPLLQTEDTPGQGDPRALPARPVQRWHYFVPRGLPPGRHSTARGTAGTQTGLTRHPGLEWTLPAFPLQKTSLPLCSPASGEGRSASQPGMGTDMGGGHWSPGGTGLEVKRTEHSPSCRAVTAGSQQRRGQRHLPQPQLPGQGWPRQHAPATWHRIQPMGPGQTLECQGQL